MIANKSWHIIWCWLALVIWTQESLVVIVITVYFPCTHACKESYESASYLIYELYNWLSATCQGFSIFETVANSNHSIFNKWDKKILLNDQINWHDSGKSQNQSQRQNYSSSRVKFPSFPILYVQSSICWKLRVSFFNDFSKYFHLFPCPFNHKYACEHVKSK